MVDRGSGLNLGVWYVENSGQSTLRQGAKDHPSAREPKAVKAWWGSGEKT
jgi:hypothetical protein